MCQKFYGTFGIYNSTDQVKNTLNWTKPQLDMIHSIIIKLISVFDNDEYYDELLDVGKQLWLSPLDARIDILAEKLGLTSGVDTNTFETIDECVNAFTSSSLKYYYRNGQHLLQLVFSLGSGPSEPPVPFGEIANIGGDKDVILYGAVYEDILSAVSTQGLPTMDVVSDFVGYTSSNGSLLEIPRLNVKWTDGDCSTKDLNEHFLGPYSTEPVCTWNDTAKCCLVERALSNNYEYVLRQMKHSINPIAWDIEEKSDEEDHKKGMEALARFQSYRTDDITQNYYPMIFGSTIHSDDKPQYSRGISTTGITVSTNSADFWTLFKKTPYTEAFFKEIVDKREFSGTSSTLKGKQFPSGLGTRCSYQALVLVDKNDITATGGAKGYITLHGYDDLPDPRLHSIKLLPGKTYDIVVKPSHFVSDQRVLDLKPDDRQCMTREDDHELVLFNDYSNAACSFECQLQRAMVLCNCVPWKYPPPLSPKSNKHINLCHKEGNRCFERALSEDSGLEECACPKDCSFVKVQKNYLLSSLSKNVKIHYNFL